MTARPSKPPSGASSTTPHDLPPELRTHEQYEVLRELGRGGMGVVYLARNRLMKRLEVLKVVNPQLLDRPDTRARFLREISSAAQLHNPHIVTAYSASQFGNLLVLSLEYVEGENLAEVVERAGPLPVANACYYLHQAALGLQHAHEKGMVHRDIKPHNLILGRDGSKPIVKILDFGLAKLTNQLEATSGNLTETGATMGTLLFIAPEQIKDAASADIRADDYSLGCTAYYLLTANSPFETMNQLALMHAHLELEPGSLHGVRREVPVELAAVVAKMMAKDPAQRYQKPAEVARALVPFAKAGLEPLPGATSQASPRPRPVAEASPPRAETHPALRPSDRRAASAPVADLWPTQIEAEGRTAGARRPPSSRARAGSAKWLLAAGVGTLLLSLGVGLGLWMKRVPGPKSSDSAGARASDSAGASLVVKVRDISGIELVEIPSGWFYMGSNANEEGYYGDEKPRHKVTISQAFYLGKYKVTVGQFRRFVEALGYKTEAEEAGDSSTWRNPGFVQTDEYPVVYVSWNDADAYCRWLAKETGAKGRLPREAEWEYSCRAQPNTTTTTRYFFGDNDAQLGEYAWFSGHSEGHMHPCGQKKPNAFGLYDMHGLAWEWCADGKRAYENKEETDPMGPSTGAPRVYRGGSWGDDPQRCRAAARNDYAPSYRNLIIGFRVLVVR